jgi:hypothetical protein
MQIVVAKPGCMRMFHHFSVHFPKRPHSSVSYVCTKIHEQFLGIKDRYFFSFFLLYSFYLSCTECADPVVTLYACIREVLGSNFGPDIDYPE